MEKNISNIFKEFSRTVQSFSLKNAIVYHENNNYQSLTYYELYLRALRLASFLKSMGVKPKDKVAVILGNQPEYVVSFFAVVSLGASIVPVDTQFSNEQIKNIIAHSDAKILITNKARAKVIASHINNVAIIEIDSDETIKKISSYPDKNIIDDHSLEDNLAAIFYTSGTTDEPKGVALTQGNLLSNVYALNALGIVTEPDRIISILPFHHAYAFMATMLLPLLSGATIVFPSGISSKELLSCMKEAKITIFVAVPQVFSLIKRSIANELNNLNGITKLLVISLAEILFLVRKGLRINLSKYVFLKVHKMFGGKLRLLVSGGARLDKDVALSFYKWGFLIVEGYGLTETSPVVTFNQPNSPKIGSVGKVLPGVEIKIIEPDNKGIGEVLIKGPNVMAGYYKQEEKTRQVIKDGWFYSGDLGFVDNGGNLYLVGRKKTLIVLSSGKKVDPEEIENIYSKSKYIRELCVFPISKEGFLSGVEHLAAVIVAEEQNFNEAENANVRNKIKSELENLSAGLPSYKHISGFVIIRDNLPRTALGKIMRYKVEEIFKSAQHGNKQGKEVLVGKDLEIYNSKMAKPTLDALNDILKKEVTVNDHLELDLGLDSLSKIDVLLTIQERLGLEMTDEQTTDFFMSSTVKDLLVKLKEYFPDGPSKVKVDAVHHWDEIIKQYPSQDTIAKMVVKKGFIAVAINIIILALIKIIFRVFFLLRVEGRENLKKYGPYLLCPNHTSFLDGLIVFSALPFKVALEVQFVGYSLIFNKIFLKELVRTGFIIPIDSNLNLIEALRACTFALSRFKIVCYFPEGERSFNGELTAFKKGVGILVKELKIPVVPVYIDGAFKAWPRAKRFPRLYPIKIKFGEKVSLDVLSENAPKNQDVYEVIAGNLRERVLNLSKKTK